MNLDPRSSSPITFANALTIGRILLIPVIFVALLYETPTGRWVASILFVVACATDFVDGFIARLLEQQTPLGEFLDPIADKLLVGSTLLFLAGFQHLKGHALMPAAIILCREILVSGLREWLSQFHERVPVTKLAKWKTTIQLIAITFILLGHPDTGGDLVLTIGIILLYLAAALTIYTGGQYFFKAGRYFVGR
jgi:cardiolipin synthase